MRKYESEGVMDAWSELFGATEFSPRLEAALRASIPEHQAKLLSAGLGEIAWVVLKLGYKGVEVGGFWENRTDAQVEALIAWVNRYGDAKECNAELVRLKNENSLTAAQLFSELVDVTPEAQFSGDAATDPRLDALRKESATLVAGLSAAMEESRYADAIRMQEGAWPDLAKRIAELTNQLNLKPIDGAIFGAESLYQRD
jgi:hypothetical protein